MDKVTFYRHHRAKVSPNQHSTHYALSFRFDLDFDRREIKASFCVCNGDIFRKSFARHLTDERMVNTPYVFPMPDCKPDSKGWDKSVAMLFAEAFVNTHKPVRDMLARHGKKVFEAMCERDYMERVGAFSCND